MLENAIVVYATPLYTNKHVFQLHGILQTTTSKQASKQASNLFRQSMQTQVHSEMIITRYQASHG